MKKFKDFPNKYLKFSTKINLSEKEFNILKDGKISKSMDERWNIIYNNDWLFFYRSWTGNCIYKVEIKHELKDDFSLNVYVNNLNGEYKTEDKESEIKYFKDLFNLYIQGKI